MHFCHIWAQFKTYRSMTDESCLLDDFLQHEGGTKANWLWTCPRGLEITLWNSNISPSPECFLRIVYFFSVLEAAGGGHAHSSLLHLIHLCLTTAGLFPRQMENTRERAQPGQRTAEVVWFLHSHFISLCRNPLGLPSGTQTCLCWCSAQIDSFPFKTELISLKHWKEMWPVIVQGERQGIQSFVQRLILILLSSYEVSLKLWWIS